MEEYQQILSFVKELERLKNTSRTAWTSTGRQESVAEHSWRLALFSLSLEEYFPDVDLNRVMRLALVHDLGEAYEGDVSATIPVNPAQKFSVEEEAWSRLTEPLSREARQKFMDLWQEYHRGETKEARLVKALDKMETIIQHNQGLNPSDFDFEFNLGYGKMLAHFDPVLQAIRACVDSDTRLKCL